MTALELLIDYFNNKCIYHSYRSVLLGDLAVYYRSTYAESTIDNILSLLTKAKYIKRVGRGLYRVLKHIPEDITLTQLKQLSNNHDNT